MEKNSLYREKALEKLMSNRSLDAALSIVKPIYWIAAIGGILLFVALCVWGLFGYVDSTTDCYGFNYTSGSSNKYYWEDSGVVLSINKDSGRYIRQGETLYTYRSDTTKAVESVGSPVTGVIINNEIFPGSIICPGQNAFSIRAFNDPDKENKVLFETEPGTII